MAIEIPALNFSALQNLANSFFNGAVIMGKLNDYPFYMHQNDYKNISFSGSSSFSSYQPIKGLEVLGDSGGTSADIRLDGVLVAEPLDALNGLENLWIMREPVRFTTLDRDFEAVITSYNVVQSNFYLDGSTRVQRYSLTLKEIYGEIA